MSLLLVFSRRKIFIVPVSLSFLHFSDNHVIYTHIYLGKQKLFVLKSVFIM